MALYYDLKVFKDVYSLILKVFEYTQDFPREYKEFIHRCWYHFPHEFLANASNRIINEVKGVNRVCYDISSKPPATIEWE